MEVVAENQTLHVATTTQNVGTKGQEEKARWQQCPVDCFTVAKS